MPFKHYIIVSSVLKVSSDDTPQLHHIAENFRGRKLSTEKTFEGENFWGRKLSQISLLCGYLWKFSRKILGHGVLWRSKSEQSTKLLWENRILTNLQKFSLESFPLYGILEKLVEETALWHVVTMSKETYPESEELRGDAWHRPLAGMVKAREFWKRRKRIHRHMCICTI